MGPRPVAPPRPPEFLPPGVETGAGHIALPIVGCHCWRDQMSSRAEYYRGRGIEALQRAAQATKPEIRLAFEEVASGWFVLAEQVDWLDRRRHSAPEEKPKESLR